MPLFVHPYLCRQLILCILQDLLPMMAFNYHHLNLLNVFLGRRLLAQYSIRYLLHSCSKKERHLDSLSSYLGRTFLEVHSEGYHFPLHHPKVHSVRFSMHDHFQLDQSILLMHQNSDTRWNTYLNVHHLQLDQLHRIFYHRHRRMYLERKVLQFFHRN